MEKYLWRFNFDYGRSGDLDGLFVATEEEVQNAIGQDVNFGEALGKHSEVYGTIEASDISKVNISSEAVEEVSNHLGKTWSGWNPLNYIRLYCYDCGERIEVRDGELYSHDSNGNVICHPDDECEGRDEGDNE